MIGSDALGSVLGAVPAGDPERIPNLLRALIRIGLSPVLNKPGTKIPICVLSAPAAKKADMEAQAAYLAEHPEGRADSVTHACGLKHVLDDPAKVAGIVKRAQAVHGEHLNIGIHLGRSRLLVVDVDTPQERAAFDQVAYEDHGTRLPPITVESPGAQNEAGEWIHWGGGHWWFQVPAEFEFPRGKVFKGPGGWAAMWGESQVLAPPSVRPEGAYRLTGGVHYAPEWLRHAIHSAPVQEERDFTVTTELSGNPIEQWSGRTSWAQLLEPDGWTPSGTNTDCGCPNYRAPGGHASPKSATAHEAGCTVYDTSTGWAPLKIWTDHPPEGLPPEGAVTKFDYVSRLHFGADTAATKRAIGVPEDVVVPPFVLALGGTPTAPVTGVRTVSLTRSSDMAMRTTRWSWIDMEYRAKWIPQGALSLLGGREGMGKSTLAYWIAAQITRGTLPGDNYGRPRSVIISATEDAWEQTANPRLAAAGADRTRVFRADVHRADDLMEGLVLPTDVPAVREACRVHDVGLILLDPLLGSIGGRLDTHKDSEVRQALEPLSRLAHDAQVTVIGLIHENKSGTGDRITKLMGSRAFSAVARAVLLCAEEPNPVDVSDAPERTFLFGQLKSNLGPKVQSTLRYRIREQVVGRDPDFGDEIWSSSVEWIGRLDQNIELVLDQPRYAPETPRSEAGAWILDLIAERGPSSRKEVLEAAGQAGHSKNTAERALNTLTGAVPPRLVAQRDGRVVILSLPAEVGTPDPPPLE